MIIFPKNASVGQTHVVDMTYRFYGMPWIGMPVSMSSLKGEDGFTAYQCAVKMGYMGSEEDWIESLECEQGIRGLTGQSAYDYAVSTGFVGSYEECLASLVGSKGDKGDKGNHGDAGVAGDIDSVFDQAIG